MGRYPGNSKSYNILQNAIVELERKQQAMAAESQSLTSVDGLLRGLEDGIAKAEHSVHRDEMASSEDWNSHNDKLKSPETVSNMKTVESNINALAKANPLKKEKQEQHLQLQKRLKEVLKAIKDKSSLLEKWKELRSKILDNAQNEEKSCEEIEIRSLRPLTEAKPDLTALKVMFFFVNSITEGILKLYCLFAVTRRHTC
jgi:hypothetical protein